MKKLIVILGMSLTFVINSGVKAGEWSTWYPVHLVYVHSNGDVYFQLNPVSTHINPDACATPSWFIVKPENKSIDRIYKMLLTAKASGIKVRPFVSGCYANKPVVHHMMMWN